MPEIKQYLLLSADVQCSITAQGVQKAYNAGRDDERKRIVDSLRIQASGHEHVKDDDQHRYAAMVLRWFADSLEQDPR